jgi:hypothetical protein
MPNIPPIKTIAHGFLYNFIDARINIPNIIKDRKSKEDV